MGKRKFPRESVKQSENTTSKDVVLAPTIKSDEPPIKQPKWTNKERVLIFSSRGISFRDRHLMNDLRNIMPHARTENKMDRKDKLFIINEMCEMKNCNKCIFFESRKKKDLYVWFGDVPRGPSAKFLVENVHTMLELKMTGNCLKGSRPLLSFDKTFDKDPHWSVLKELFTQIFSTPYCHPKSQPFIDHVLSFSIHDNRVWFRNYQILEEDGQLAEIGPRFVLNPVKIFEGSFGGSTLYQNPQYTSPNEMRKAIRKKLAMKYVSRIQAKDSLAKRRPEVSYQLDKTDEIFQTVKPQDKNKPQNKKKNR